MAYKTIKDCKPGDLVKVAVECLYVPLAPRGFFSLGTVGMIVKIWKLTAHLEPVWRCDILLHETVVTFDDYGIRFMDTLLPDSQHEYV